MPTYRQGALHVVEQARDTEPILRELKQLDRRLFLERQITYAGEYVWCVVCDLGEGQVPVTLLEWRDDDGRPIAELSTGIVYRMQKMDRDPKVLMDRIHKRNAELRQREQEFAQAEYEEMARQMGRKHAGKERYVLPRSHSLKRARDKRRNIGELK